MSKEFLTHTFSAIKDNYTWSLYFFKVDRRANNPYKMQKVRFKNPEYLKDYVSHLISLVSVFQIDKVDGVQLYDGMNTKISCDKLPLDSSIIAEPWEHFNLAATNASDKELDGRITGYILKGERVSDNNELPTISMVKVANPIVDFSNKKSIVYKATADNELDLISDSFYRLYLAIDFLIVRQNLYAFNHNFEPVFDIEKTLSKIKTQAAGRILDTHGVANKDEFSKYISQYKSPRTFITLNESRMLKASEPKGREQIAGLLKIDIDNDGLLVIPDMDKASYLIKYLCYKIFQEAETNDILEASTITKIHIS